ncbi:MAG: hypothetical protein GY904_14215 [Planctomycetaceae bacterium]|nr:hypothetical protein [Planctomycetaceae bacterium]
MKRYFTAEDIADDLDAVPTHTPTSINSCEVQLSASLTGLIEQMSNKCRSALRKFEPRIVTPKDGL